MKRNVSFNVNEIITADPARIKERHPNANYERFYKICTAIPMFISFSLVFFMIFYISPRGESMQQYQKGIYEWNKNRLDHHMSSVAFKYHVTPYVNPTVGNFDGFALSHRTDDELNDDTSSQNSNGHSNPHSAIEEVIEFQETIRQIYYYQQSYFRAQPVQRGIFSPTVFKQKPSAAESYCIGALWMSKDSAVANIFDEADEQPICLNDDPLSENVGLTFDLFKWEANQDFSCRLNAQACEVNCGYLWGFYNPDDGNCYEFKALNKLCITVDFGYFDNLPASQAEIVSSTKVTGGCFVDGDVASYQTIYLDPQATGEYKVDYDNVSVEVRHDQDPYTIFTKIESNGIIDLSIFFWLSMGCLAIALLLIVYLGFFYSYYISQE